MSGDQDKPTEVGRVALPEGGRQEAWTGPMRVAVYQVPGARPDWDIKVSWVSPQGLGLGFSGRTARDDAAYFQSLVEQSGSGVATETPGEQAISEPAAAELDAQLTRLDEGIAAEHMAMDELLGRLASPAGR